MLRVAEGEDVFFDSSDYWVPEESAAVEGDMMRSNSGYNIWLREPQSIKERREAFLSRMGFVECSTPVESVSMGFERSMEASTVRVDDNLLYERRKSNSEAHCSVDYSDQDWLDDMSIEENLVSGEQCEMEKFKAGQGENPIINKNKKAMRLWRHLTQKAKKSGGANLRKESKLCAEAGIKTRVRVEQNGKRCMDCTAVYVGQELKAHNGLIWVMKFSPDGRYLASGGEDGVVCIWRVTMVNASCKTDKCSWDAEGKSSPQTKRSGHASIIIPEKIFHVEEESVQKLHGHSGGVLDLAWSTSNQLLSSSKDQTVRLWKVGSNKCLGVFHHSNYVTCVQFNPVNENYFISGSIDGKVRIWGIPRRRVVDWANVRDIVTAVCYQPNGEGFVVGSVSGTCRFYELSGDELLRNAEININGRKKSSGCRITGIQFLKNDTQRVMITSEDSKIRILEGLEVVRKYKGPTGSGGQISASFTSSGKHIVSVGSDFRIYMWNHDDLSLQTSKQSKSTRSCEYFFSEGVSVALPWSGLDMEQEGYAYGTTYPFSVRANNQQERSSSRQRDSQRFTLANWFSMDSSCRASTIWPKEKLPLWELPSLEHGCQPYTACVDHLHQRRQKEDGNAAGIISNTWGLVIVTASYDGTIRAFHNYGLPVRSLGASRCQRNSGASHLNLCRPSFKIMGPDFC